MAELSYNLPHYPSISKNNFVVDILKKLEYQEIVAKRINNANSTTLYREAMLRMIGPNTPYNRLLIIHSVGTGKTACAIGIVEQYRKYYKQAIILNKSDVPTENFKDLLDRYFVESNVSINEIDRARSFYKFDTYSKFSKKVSTSSVANLKETYERTIFIMDEVHNIVTKTHNEDEKNYSILLSLFDMLETSIIVGMTATPMRDSYKEFIPLSNMFIKNPNDRIEEGNCDVDAIADTLKKFANTTISWYSQDFTFEVEEIGETSEELLMPTVLLDAGVHQVDTYKRECELIRLSKENSNKGKHNFMDKNLIYASLAAFPGIGITVDNLLIEIIESNKVKYVNYLFNNEYSDMLEDIQINPNDYSCKFAYTMMHIENDERFIKRNDAPWSMKPINELFDGLIYIFCEDITVTGIKTMIAMFQLFGYEYYTGGPIETLSINPRRFTVYAGDKAICPNGKERLDTFRDKLNETGMFCKIIIASNVMKESVSLKAVRKVFIWTSHWNYSAIIQAQGRAIRRDAFIERDVENKVEIHRLAAIIDRDLLNELSGAEKNDIYNRLMREASIDVYKYNRSTMKMKDIAKINSILKENSFDYHINDDISVIANIDVDDYSTYVDSDIEHLSTMRKQIEEKLSNNRMYYISDLVDILSSMLTLTLRAVAPDEIKTRSVNLLVQYLDKLSDTPLRIDNTTKYIKIKNDIVYATEDPLSDEFPIEPTELAEYRYDILSEYVDTRLKLRDDFNWSMSRLELVKSIKEYIKYNISIIEEAVRIIHKEKNPAVEAFIYHLHFYLFKINGYYYHTIEKNRISNAKYSNNSASVASGTIIRKYDPKSDKWGNIDKLESQDIATRIRYIRNFNNLQIIINYGLYGSYSFTDGELRIHNYDRHYITEEDKITYIRICDDCIKYLMTSKIVTDQDIKKMDDYDLEIRKRVICILDKNTKDNYVINITDRRTDKRGMNVNSYTKEHRILFILKFYLDCATKEEYDRFFKMRVREEYIDHNQVLLPHRLEYLLASVDEEDRIYMYYKYVELNRYSTADLRIMVENIIDGSGMFVVN